jgi:16S rRNA (cytidine1402-2'-O)-methyltransferase
VPGPASPVAALTASGLPTDTFLYLGYLPRKSVERKKVIKQVAKLPYTLIFLETPHRLLDSLEDLEAVLGDRQIALARELTKLHEEIWRGKSSEARQYFKTPRGEFVLVVAGKMKEIREKWAEEKLLAAIGRDLKAGESPSALAAKLAVDSGWARRDIYKLTIQQT